MAVIPFHKNEHQLAFYRFKCKNKTSLQPVTAAVNNTLNVTTNKLVEFALEIEHGFPVSSRASGEKPEILPRACLFWCAKYVHAANAADFTYLFYIRCIRFLFKPKDATAHSVCLRNILRQEIDGTRHTGLIDLTMKFTKRCTENSPAKCIRTRFGESRHP